MKRYLVYKSWNGQVHTSIEYGDHTDGENRQKNLNELKRIDLTGFEEITDIKRLKLLFPLEEAKNEETTVNS